MESEFSGQHKPHKLSKLKLNLADLQEVWNEHQTLLDVGCNIGNIYRALGKPRNYIGIDICEAYISQARKEHPEARFEVADLFDLKYSADIVLCSRVLMHLDNFMDAIQHLKRAGRCVLFVPVSGDSLTKEQYEEGVSYFRTFSRKTLRKCGPCTIYAHEPYSTVIYD